MQFDRCDLWHQCLPHFVTSSRLFSVGKSKSPDVTVSETKSIDMGGIFEIGADLLISE